MTREHVTWRTARPLWTSSLNRGTGFDQPAILRFATDDFMELFQARLACEQAELASLVAGAETWEDPGAGLDTRFDTPEVESIKLFQPTHGRYYIVTGSLVCARYGMPDKAVASNAGEQVSFLLRRLVPKGPSPVDPTNTATFDEYAWIATDGGGYWDQVTPGAADDHEQRLPVFPMPYGDTAKPKRLLAGLIPVSAREAYERSPSVTASDASGSTDPLAALVDPRLRPLEPIVMALQGLLVDTSVEQPDLDLMREALFFAMVDLAHWLDQYFPGSLDGGFDPSGLATRLDTQFDIGAGLSWLDALVDARDAEAAAVFDANSPAPQPVAGVDAAEIVAAIGRLGVSEGDLSADPPQPLAPSETVFFGACRSALPPAVVPVAVPTSGPSTAAADPTDPRSVYAARFLYERPQCLPSERQMLSELSRPFTLAPFHDPDAPARPVRIAMPVDTSPEGLRKFPKNVSIVLSAELRKQIQRVDAIKLSDIDDGNIPDGPSIDFGMICSLSIPIITICALILLMIIVSLLNIVFFWVPFFKICLPVPRSDS